MNNNTMKNTKANFVASRAFIACTCIAECFKKAEYTNPLISGRLLVASREVVKVKADEAEENSKLKSEKENFMGRFGKFLEGTTWEKESFSEYRCRIDVAISEKFSRISVETGLLDFTVEVNEKGWFTFSKDFELPAPSGNTDTDKKKPAPNTDTEEKEPASDALTTPISSFTKLSA